MVWNGRLTTWGETPGEGRVGRGERMLQVLLWCQPVRRFLPLKRLLAPGVGLECFLVPLYLGHAPTSSHESECHLQLRHYLSNTSNLLALAEINTVLCSWRQSCLLPYCDSKWVLVWLYLNLKACVQYFFMYISVYLLFCILAFFLYYICMNLIYRNAFKCMYFAYFVFLCVCAK